MGKMNMKLSIGGLGLLLVVASLLQSSTAFVMPLSKAAATSSRPTFVKTSSPTIRPPTTTAVTSTQLNSSNLIDGKQLTTFFLEAVISSGVPAVFTILVIFFAVSAFRPKKKDMEEDMYGGNAVSELYEDLYGGSSSDNSSGGGSSKWFRFFGRRDGSSSPPQNSGVPSQQYISITNINSRLDSYQYSMTAAIQSKAVAAAQVRSKNFDRALGLAVSSSASSLPASFKAELLEAEKDFLKDGSRAQSKITNLQARLTRTAIDQEMKAIGVSPKDLDPQSFDTAGNSSFVLVVRNDTKNETFLDNVQQLFSKKKDEDLWKELSKAQQELMKVELTFVQDVVNIMGPERANGIRAALLGDVASRGAGGLLAQLKDRPLTTLIQELETGDQRRKNVFLTEFPGDVTASQVSDLREEVTAIVRSAKPGDEALVVLQSGGGTVTGYGLAAAQLQRFKQNGMKLTICVEEVAASGGYMMCCVADRIVASPFAVLGSIGVITDIPNVYERLKQEGIEFQTITAGKYKRTVTPTKKVTKDDIEKTKTDIEDILALFKAFVKENRPSLDIDAVATGETWFGTDALDRGLCDEIKTVDDVVAEYVDQGYNVYDVMYDPPSSGQLELSELLPIPGGKTGIFGRAIRWLVRTVAAEIKSELGDLSASQSVQRKYMIKDDSADRIRLE